MRSVAVIIPTLGESALLSDCLESLVAQDMQPSEIIVVANGCGKSVYDITRRVSDQICILRLARNEGFSRAVNKGIRASSAEFVLVLNDDALLDAGCISALLSVTNNESYGSFAPSIFTLDGSSVQSTGLMFSNSGYGNRSNRNKFCAETKLRDVFSVCGAAALYLRAALEDVGFFNEDFFFLFEDLEMGFRLQLRGYKCLLVPSARVFHAGGATAKRYFQLKVEQCIANSLTTAITCMPWAWLVQDKQRMARFYIALSKACFKKGYGGNVMKGILRCIGRLPKSFRLRQAIHKKAIYDDNYLRQLLYEGDIVVGFPDGEARICIN